jgi:hypothetical protein
MTSLRGHERREFPVAVKRAAFKRCCDKDGKPRCENCGNLLVSGNITYEHLQPDGLQGEPTLENCGVWCTRPCSKAKDRIDNPRMVKADRVTRKTYGLTPAKAKIQSAGFQKRPPQRSASRPVSKHITKRANGSPPTHGGRNETKFRSVFE